MDYNAPIARPIAPEEIRPGHYVSVLSVLYEHMPCLWDVDEIRPTPTEPVRLRWLPDRGGLPLEVLSVCLPFVLVRRPNGRHLTLDVRRYRLVRLSRAYGARATEELRRDAEAKSRPRPDDSTSQR